MGRDTFSLCNKKEAPGPVKGLHQSKPIVVRVLPRVLYHRGAILSRGNLRVYEYFKILLLLDMELLGVDDGMEQDAEVLLGALGEAGFGHDVGGVGGDE